jgi:hypothetical protein
MLELLVPFLQGLVTAVPKMVGSWVETRNSIRVEHVRAHLNTLAEERRVQTAIRLHEAELTRQQAAGYPLGVPGRLRTLLPGSGLPTVIVSPPPPESPLRLDGLADRVRELVTAVDGFSSYAAMPSGVFARDAGVPRFLDGEVGARTVADAEFAGRPAILIYFEPGGRSLTARAYLSAVFGTTGGAAGFPFPIARYGMGLPGGAAAMRDTDLPSWHHVDLTAVPNLAPVEVAAATIGWFLLSVLDTYWQLTAGVTAGLLARSGAARMIDVGPPAEPAEPIGLGRLARLEFEARRLSGLGYRVAAEELPGGYAGLHLTGPQDVIFVVDASYPQLPPVVIRTGDCDVHIDAADWSAECTLTDIVEALR